MSGESISQIPLQATSINGQTDLLELSQYTGNLSAPYVTKKVLAGLLSGPVVHTAIEFSIGMNRGYNLDNGFAGYMIAPYAATITAATLIIKPLGTLTLDIWKCSAAQYDAGLTHPVIADTICGGNPLQIVSAASVTNNTLSGWTTAFNSGDIFAFNISGTDGKASSATLCLNVTKTTIP